MHADIQRILIPRQRIAQRVAELAEQITADHHAANAAEDEVTIIPILTGAMIFCADLIRHMPLAMRIGLIGVSSYPGRSIRAQEASILGQQIGQVAGRHVLLIDDILDSGGTLAAVLPMLHSLVPVSVKSCVLLRKDRPSARQVHVDYVGFDIPDEFVVGYGLDYDDRYRNLPDIVTLRSDILSCST